MAATDSGLANTIGPQDQPRLGSRALTQNERPASLGMTRSIARQSNISQPRSYRSDSRR